MNYRVSVPGEKDVYFRDWREVEAYLTLLRLTDWQAYICSVVSEI